MVHYGCAPGCNCLLLKISSVERLLCLMKLFQFSNWYCLSNPGALSYPPAESQVHCSQPSSFLTFLPLRGNKQAVHPPRQFLIIFPLPPRPNHKRPRIHIPSLALPNRGCQQPGRWDLMRLSLCQGFCFLVTDYAQKRQPI